ncbi:MAG: JAB domain-containing protein, partial [Bacteroidetes bacterium]|nr:JAB domain-containing protein [Bacteroidota bacterium]
MKQEKGLQPMGKVAEIELVYRSKLKSSDRPIIRTSRDAYNIFYAHYDKNKMELVEEFYAMFLNRANKVLGVYKVSSGGITGTVADPRLLFTAAIKLGSCFIIMCHNHPSQN